MNIKQPRDYDSDALKALQARTGYTNAKFAEALGVTQRTWETLKFGRRPLSVVQRRALTDLERSLPKGRVIHLGKPATKPIQGA